MGELKLKIVSTHKNEQEAVAFCIRQQYQPLGNALWFDTTTGTKLKIYRQSKTSTLVLMME